MHDIEGGIMANMEDVIRNTLPEILKNQNYKPEKDAILQLELGFGMDGAGLYLINSNDHFSETLFLANAIGYDCLHQAAVCLHF